jgi:thiamine biosynthesis lipoprotein
VIGETEATLVRFAARAMASPLRLTLDPHRMAGDGGGETVETAWAGVVAEFEHCEETMSRFRETSELTVLNRAAGTGRDVAVGWRLRRAVVVADRARRVTGGTFDPRVLADLDRLGYRGAALRPAPAPPIEPVGRQRPRGGRVGCPSASGGLRVDVPIDLGGIGKGLALRWAADGLDRVGFSSFLLEAGGDLVARGGGPGDGGWRVGIEDPAGGDAPLAVIEIRDLAVATSSIGVHSWRADGRSVHHLIDPVTGQPGGEGLLAVTVAASDPAWAEVWAKSLFLAGRVRVAGLARARGLAAWWVGADRTLAMTPAARIRTIWVAAEA